MSADFTDSKPSKKHLLKIKAKTFFFIRIAFGKILFLRRLFRKNGARTFVVKVFLGVPILEKSKHCPDLKLNCVLKGS